MMHGWMILWVEYTGKERMIVYSITSGIPNMCVFVLYVYHESLVRLFTYFIQCALTFVP